MRTGVFLFRGGEMDDAGAGLPVPTDRRYDPKEVWRGTVPREAETLGTQIGSFDNPDKAAADELNRRQFDEAMQVMRLALDNDAFSFHGEVYDFPPAGIPDHGQPAKPGLIPTLEESIDQRVWAVGSPADVAEAISTYDDQIGIENLLLFVAMPGDPYEKVEEQLHRIAEEVLPLLS